MKSILSQELSPKQTRLGLTIVVVGAAVVAALVIRAAMLDPAKPSTTTSEPTIADEGQPDLAETELDKEKQQYIWDVEHVTFELETRFGKPFVQAIQANAADKLRDHFRDDFQATLLNDQVQVIREHGPLSETVRRAIDGPSGWLDADTFVAALLQDAETIQPLVRGRLRVLHLDQDANESQLWHSRLLLSLFGSNDGESRISESEHEVDFRVTSEEDIGSRPIVQRWRALSQSIRTGRQPLMEEVTEQVALAGLPLIDNWKIDKSMTQQYWSQMAVEDFNADGYPDIAVATFVGQPFLLQSDGGRRFRNVSGEMGIRPWQLDNEYLVNLAVWIDYDNDGFPDLLLGNRLYHNLGGTGFKDVTQQSQLVIQHHPMGGVVADYDCDGLPDLYLLYQHPTETVEDGPQPWVGDTKTGAENQLWRNMGGGRFRNMTAASGAGGGRRKSFAATWHFFDDDRFPDLYVANDFGNNVHLRNRGDGTFEDISQQTGMTDFATSMGVASGDIDNDGSPEIYVANMYSKMGRRIIQHVGTEDYPEGIFEQIKGSCAGNRLYRRQDGSKFRDISDEFGVNPVGWAYAPVLTDLDGDGWLDIYATTGFMSFHRDKPDG